MNERNWKQRIMRLMVGLVLGAGVISPLAASQLVTFTRGQSIVVDNVERRDDWYYLTLEGGGEMGVPARLVAKVENYEAPPPSAAAAPGTTPPGPAAPAAGAATTPPGTPPGRAPETAALAPAPGPASPASPNPGTPNVMSQSDDWRYKVRMSGGPRKLDALDRTGGGRQGMGGGRLAGPGPRRNPPATPAPPQQ